MKKAIPEFKSEAEEFEFWSSSGDGADSTEFVDWSEARRVRLPNLKPTLRTISVRLPVAMIEDLKILANKRDVPYQSLLKVFLAERLEAERRQKIGSEASSMRGQSFTKTNSESNHAVRRPCEDSTMTKKHELFIEQRPEGDYAVRRPGSSRASAVESTQAEAINRARQIDANASIAVERVRDTDVGGRDKWRKP